MRWLADAEEWQVTLSHLVPGAGDLSQHERGCRVAANGEGSVYVSTEIIRAKIVVSGAGGLVEPRAWPEEIPGIENFEGDVIHTARWSEQADLKAKDVIVIGSGCSAAQVVPELISSRIDAKSVTQLMRTPPWVQPDLIPQILLPTWERYSPALMRNVPGLAHLLRAVIFWVAELDFFQMFLENGFAHRRRAAIEKQFTNNMRANTPVKYHDILAPKYSLGCKRRIISNDWYRSLQSSKVELTTLPLISVQSKSVTLGPREQSRPPHQTNGNVQIGEVRQVPADAIILANGYQSNKFLHPLQVIGKNSKPLQEIWDERGGAQAYLGIAMDQFPNFFMIFGPNMSTGHSSVIFASENAINYSLKFIKPILDGHISTYEVTEEAERNWTSKIQNALQKTVFKRGGCLSWYETEGGWNSSTYPFSQIDFYLRCTFPVWRHWTAKYTPKGLRMRRFRTAFKRLILALILTGLVHVGVDIRQQGAGSWRRTINAAGNMVEWAFQRSSRWIQHT